MNNRCIPNQDVVGRVDTTFTDLDQQRTQNLEKLQQIQTVQNASLAREQQRLVAKYGENHPRVQKANARLTYNQGVQRDLSKEVERSKIDVPQLDRNTWKGHGFVLNQDQVGIPDLTITFVDEQDNWIRALGYACTDERGYFSLLYPKQATETPPTPDFPPIFLTVTNANRQVVYRDRTSRTVKLGQVDFWRIVLGEEPGGTCEPPEPPDTPPGKAVQVRTLNAPEQLTVNQPGSFSATVNDDATPPITSRWNFGDGTTAEGLTATHAYSNPGDYSINFSASNVAGQDARTTRITVNPVGTAVRILAMVVPQELTVNQSGGFNARVNSEATPPVTTQWNFGDGATAEGLTPSHTYTKAGSYTVTFSASNVAGKDSRTSPLRVRPAPNSPQIGDIRVSPDKATTLTPIQFTAEVKGDAPLTYQWDFGDNTTTTEIAPSHTYAQANTYTVKLTVTNAVGTDTRSLSLPIEKPETLAWSVRGQVLATAGGQPVAGATVALFDPQNRFTRSQLGITETNNRGNYTLTYNSDNFPELFETRPELLVRVSDRQGNPIFTTDKPIRCTPGGVETVNITLRGGARPG